ncbi:hypothetical protein NY10_2373 [Carnobacterium antarcticum]|nr:hypothetical protein NY10_2373 [Carnobacterium sp. CP1]
MTDSHLTYRMKVNPFQFISINISLQQKVRFLKVTLFERFKSAFILTPDKSFIRKK